jgi:hypothetical protein
MLSLWKNSFACAKSKQGLQICRYVCTYVCMYVCTCMYLLLCLYVRVGGLGLAWGGVGPTLITFAYIDGLAQLPVGGVSGFPVVRPQGAACER